jgi:NTE family protein
MDVAAKGVDYQQPLRGWKPEGCDRIALVLQGGGALGAYQTGVFQALSEADIEPDWVTGVSIGAINCAIIAGNSKQWRLKRLRTFWERSERKIWSYTPDGDVFRQARNAASSWMTLVQGHSDEFEIILTVQSVTAKSGKG